MRSTSLNNMKLQPMHRYAHNKVIILTKTSVDTIIQRVVVKTRHSVPATLTHCSQCSHLTMQVMRKDAACEERLSSASFQNISKIVDKK